MALSMPAPIYRYLPFNLGTPSNGPISYDYLNHIIKNLIT